MTGGRYTVWGWTSRWPGVAQPLRITHGTVRECRARRDQFERDYPDALTGIYLSADAPKGLAFQVEERLNPADPTLDATEGCEGHVDTDDALTSGVGIGEPVCCDGSCNPKH